MLVWSPIGSPLHVSPACDVGSHAAPLCLSMLHPQLGILVQHREACRSTLSFLTRLLDPGTALARLQEQQQQRQVLGGTALDTTAVATALLQSQLDRVGPNLSRMLMGAVVGALPYSRVADIAPVIQVGLGSRRAGDAVLAGVCFGGNGGCLKVLAQQWTILKTDVFTASSPRCLTNYAAADKPSKLLPLCYNVADGIAAALLLPCAVPAAVPAVPWEGEGPAVAEGLHGSYP
jgi:hypothetical protein